MKSIIKSCPIKDVEKTLQPVFVVRFLVWLYTVVKRQHRLTLALLLPDFVSLKNSHNLCLFPHLKYLQY